MNLQIAGEGESSRFLELYRVCNTVKNDLTDVGRLGDLNNVAVLG